MDTKILSPDQVAKLFLRPKRRDNMLEELPWPSAQRTELQFEGGRLVLWEVGKGPVVLALHGWEGSVTDLKAFVPDLVRLGFRIVALELPAHGRSDGETTSLFQCIRAVNHAVAAHIGQVSAVLAHSVGCPVAVEAIGSEFKPEAVVLIATPARYKDYAQQFGRVAGLDEAGVHLMLEALYKLGVDVAALDMSKTARFLETSALLIHSDDDRVIPNSIGQEVANAWPGAEFLLVNGLGHRKILSAPIVVEAAVSFLQARVTSLAPE
ncbi:alpha/beta fold hydrolase [Alcaligenes aquatilis]|uniref:alpha/beta fold hydrolase n=1 Tax=Alcaligenes aquatilis TaxID=323284 RepID=UPI00360EDA09